MKSSWHIASAFLAVGVVSCASATSGPERGLPTAQQLDEELIDFMTADDHHNSFRGYTGMSGRILDLLLVVHTEMRQKRATRCKSGPLIRHIFLYKEFDDVVRIRSVPRFVPDDRPRPSLPPPSPPPGTKYIYTKDIFPKLPKGAYGLDRCEIDFEVDKETRKVVSTRIIR